MSQSSEWVSLGEAAQIIGVHPATIRNWAERGDLPFRRTPGGHRRFRRADLQQWLAAHQSRAYPHEAQVIVQSALGRTHMAIADRQKLLAQNWYRRLSSPGREKMRQYGLRLMDGLVQHLAEPAKPDGMDVARDLGTSYGDLLQNETLTLSEALDGYLYFNDFLVEAVLQLVEANSGRSTPGRGDMLREVHRFTRQVLVNMIGVYDTAMSSA